MSISVVGVGVVAGAPGFDTGFGYEDCENTCGVSDFDVNERAGGRLRCSRGLLMGDRDTLLIADSGNHCVRELRLSTCTLRTIAGDTVFSLPMNEDDVSPDDSASNVGAPRASGADTARTGLSADVIEAEFDSIGVVSALSANLNSPAALCWDPVRRGQLLIGCDNDYQRVIRRLDAGKDEVFMEAGDSVPAVPPFPPAEGEPMSAEFEGWLSALIARTTVEEAAALEACFSDISGMVSGRLAGQKQTLVYIACTKSHVVRSLDVQTRVVRRVCGTGLPGSHEDGHVTSPYALAIDPRGRLVISSYATCTLLRYDPSQAHEEMKLELLCGQPGCAGFVDGATAEALLGEVTSIACDRAGNVYLADFTNNAIRCVEAESLRVRTLIGPADAPHQVDRGMCAFALENPQAIAVDEITGATRLFVSDFHRILQFNLETQATLDATNDLFDKVGTRAATRNAFAEKPRYRVQGSRQLVNWRSASFATASTAAQRGLAGSVAAPARPKGKNATAAGAGGGKDEANRKSSSACAVM